MAGLVVMVVLVLVVVVGLWMVEGSEGMERPSVDARELLDARIVGGSKVPLADKTFGWIASVQYRKSRDHFCGGSLVAKDWVLTAAHCVDTPGMDLVVQVGAYDLNSFKMGKLIRVRGNNKGYVRNVREIITHNGFGYNQNDIALLRIDSITEVEPVRLNFAYGLGPLETTGSFVTALGWGYETEGSGNLSPDLNHVSVPLQSTNECRKKYMFVGDTHICAGVPQGGKDSCSGDSGGPLVYIHENIPVQVGIVQTGRGCARAGGYFGVYTRISKFPSFFKSAMGTKGMDELNNPVGGHADMPNAADAIPDADTDSTPRPAVTSNPEDQQNRVPTERPTKAPRKTKTSRPTVSPTHFPTVSPTPEPTEAPTPQPTGSVRPSKNRRRRKRRGLLDILYMFDSDDDNNSSSSSGNIDTPEQ